MAELLATGYGTQFEPEDLERWRQPAVYLALDGDDQPVYVGVSRNGLQRVLHQHHRAKEIRDCRLILWSLPSLAEAQELERFLLERLKPRANVRGMWPRALQAQLGVKATRAREIWRRYEAIAKRQAVAADVTPGRRAPRAGSMRRHARRVRHGT